jgi:hypothetical protein
VAATAPGCDVGDTQLSLERLRECGTSFKRSVRLLLAVEGDENLLHRAYSRVQQCGLSRMTGRVEGTTETG